MPGKVKVKIISGKNLPVMDRSSDTTDAYVEIKLGNTTYKTDVCRRTLHPHWNTDWYRFEVDDSELQDEPLQIRLMDHDTYSANDAIGKVYLNLNPLLLPVAGKLAIGDNNPHHEISGWIPVYDTMHGIRGEVNVTVKVELFSDFNRYRQSSCGVYFFYSPTVPQGYQAKIINGFVEELIVDDDPEYQWIDKIRTPRASNEARQTLFFKLSGELQRKIGVKALGLGGNAVIGYKQSFDLEGESGIVARGIGTAVTLVKVHNIHHVVVESKEEDIQKYLTFVGDGKSFSLCSAPPTHRLPFSFNPLKSFSPFTIKALSTRGSNYANRPNLAFGSDNLSSSLSNPNLHDNKSGSLKTLLSQEDKRGESAITRRFQKFKDSQKSLSKKMIALKAKLNDSIGEEADEDVQDAASDKRRHFKRTHSDSSAMAEILARSVIHATSSLSCILENQNDPKEDDTLQKLEPIANLLNKTESQTSIIDDNVSDVQSYSSSDSSSDCSDYEYRYYSRRNNDVETISNIITNVEKLQRCLSKEGLHKQQSMPAIPSKGFSLSSLLSVEKFDIKDDLPVQSKNLKESFSDNTSNLIPSTYEIQNDYKTVTDDEKQENVGLTKQVSMGKASKHEQGDKSEIYRDQGIVKTALERMLFERANILGTPDKQEDRGKSNNLIGSENQTYHQNIDRQNKEKDLKHEQGDKPEIYRDHGIVKTALETMLFEQANILGTPDKQEDRGKSNNLIGSENQTYHQNIDRQNKEKDLKHEQGDKPEIYRDQGIVKTALETMLFERANILGTPDKQEDGEKPNYLIGSKNQHYHQNIDKQSKERDLDLKISEEVNVSPSNTMVKSALDTMLFERASMLGTPTDLLKNENAQSQDTKDQHFNISKESTYISSEQKAATKPESIVRTALRTILAERANIIGSPADLPDAKPVFSFDFQDSYCESNKSDSIDYKSQDCIGRTEDSNKKFVKQLESPFTTNTTEEDTIIAPVEIKDEPKKMVKTAMQTMLLEKVNILGTYTPPTSPTLPVNESIIGGKKSFTFNEPENTIKKSTIPKSFSAASFGEHQRKMQKETVLGMPFTSLSCLLSENTNCSINDWKNYLSDSQLHNPVNKDIGVIDIVKKKRFNIFHSKHESSKHSGMFNKFLRHGKKSLPDLQKGEKDLHQNKLLRMFHLRHEAKSNKDEETQTSNEILDRSKLPTLSHINPNPNNTSNLECFIPKPPDKADMSDDFLAKSKTKLACITSNRHHSLPAQDHQDISSGEKKNEHSPDPTVRISHSPVKVNYMVPLHRRSSDSDLSITPKGNSLTGSDRSMGNAAAYFMRNHHVRKGLLNQENFEMLEYPFLTMTKFAPRFIVQIGGSISARSVKLLERILNPEEPESRDIWWSEIRMEIRSHARSLNCNAVLGYTESTSICDDVCVLSACGTAAVVDLNCSAADEDNILNVQKSAEKDKNLNGHHKVPHDSPDHRDHLITSCCITHLSYDVPVKAKVTKCPMCLKGKVPEVLIATIEPPENIPNIGKGCFIESHVARPLRDLRGETIAKEISDGLPFLEYELHRLLVNKLKIRGMNAIFSLKIRITVGEKMLVGVATGTAIYLSSLPSPDLPMLVTNTESDEKVVADLQEMLKETVKKNREIYQIQDDNQNHKIISDDESDEEQASLDISCGNKDCCILEMDDPEDAEVLALIMEEKIPDGFHVVSTESVPGLEDLEIVKNLQMFTQIYRAKLAPPYNLQKHFERLLQSVYFKLRRMVPCALCDLQFRIDLPEPDEIQLCVIGMALGLGKKGKKVRPVVLPKKPDEDLMFKLDEDAQESSPSVFSKSNPSSLKYRGPRSPSKYRNQSLKQRHIPINERHGVDITPLSYVPGGNIEQYLGNLNFFFIRETTSIREEGGLSGFIHSFVTEVLAIVRSHVTALGGNALVAFFMTECVLNHNLHKNQGQCLINVGGDVVSVSYFKDDP